MANLGEMTADTGQIPVQAPPVVEDVAAEIPDDEIPTDADIAITDAETAIDENQLSDAAHAADKAAHSPAQISEQSSEDDEDKQLRTVLNEAKRLLKEALNLLRAKHQPDDQDSRKLIKDIEDELEKLEQQLPALQPQTARISGQMQVPTTWTAPASAALLIPAFKRAGKAVV